MKREKERSLLVLDSHFRTNPEDKDHLYKFKLNARIKFDGIIRLEQFIFQNSQYVFNPEKKSDKIIYTEDSHDPVVINLKGMFDNTDIRQILQWSNVQQYYQDKNDIY